MFPAKGHFFKQIINQSIETFHYEAVTSLSRAASSQRTKPKYQGTDDLGMTRTLELFERTKAWVLWRSGGEPAGWDPRALSGNLAS